ncbi:MAG TPA: hypothetical protein VNG53_04545 [Bacteroidia bacterium]|nr:hypothetical protein [Bacteroidia bacterium]
MAKLTPKDPQYGIPVSARIRGEVAYKFNEQAEKSNKTLSRYVSEFIENALKQEAKLRELSIQIEKAEQINSEQEKKLQELSEQLKKEAAIYKNTVGKFILEITEGNEKKVNQLIQIFNAILKSSGNAS